MLSRDLDNYIVLQRARELKFTTQSGLLRRFVTFAEAAGDTHIRIDRAIDGAARTVSRNQTCPRLAVARRFAEHLVIADPAHEAPPAEAFGRWRFQRRLPHIHTGDEIAVLMAAARRLGPPGAIRGETLATLIGLPSGGNRAACLRTCPPICVRICPANTAPRSIPLPPVLIVTGCS